MNRHSTHGKESSLYVTPARNCYTVHCLSSPFSLSRASACLVHWFWQFLLKLHLQKTLPVIYDVAHPYWAVEQDSFMLQPHFNICNTSAGATAMPGGSLTGSKAVSVLYHLKTVGERFGGFEFSGAFQMHAWRFPCFTFLLKAAAVGGSDLSFGVAAAFLDVLQSHAWNPILDISVHLLP